MYIGWQKNRETRDHKEGSQLIYVYLCRDVKLQHAILGALRNLAVAPEGRHILLENDILPPCLDLISGLSLTPITHPVVMKLLATLRLLVESEVSVSVCLGESRPDVLAQIINYGNHEGDHFYDKV